MSCGDDQVTVNALGCLLAACEAGDRNAVMKYGATLHVCLQHSDAGELVRLILNQARLGAIGEGFVNALIVQVANVPELAQLLGVAMCAMGAPALLAGYAAMLTEQWRDAERQRIQEQTRDALNVGLPVDFAMVARQVQELDAVGASDSRLCLTAGDLLALPDHGVQWQVAGLIPRSELTILSGIGASGKSYLMSWLTLALSRGEPFLGHDVQSAATLYLDCENAAAHAAHRFRAFGLQPSDRVNVLCTADAGRLDVGDPHGFNRLRDAVKESGADVVIVDTLRRVTGADLNDAGEVDRALSLLRDATEGRTLIVLHHWRKATQFDGGQGERLMGSADLRNFARAHLVLATERVDDLTSSTLTVEKSNFAEGALPVIRYTWQRDAEGFLHFVLADADAPLLGAADRFILRQLDDAGVLRGDLLGRCEKQGIGERDMQRSLTRLAGEGMVQKVACKINGKSQVRYALP